MNTFQVTPDYLGINLVGLMAIATAAILFLAMLFIPKRVFRTYHNIRFVIMFRSWPWQEPRTKKVVQARSVDPTMLQLALILHLAYTRQREIYMLMSDNHYSAFKTRFLVSTTKLVIKLRRNQFYGAANIAGNCDYFARAEYKQYLPYFD